MTSLNLVQVKDRLNKLLNQDPLAISHLVELRVDCGPLHITNPRCDHHMSFYGRPLMGMVELLNTLFDDDQVIGTIRAVDQVKQFVLRPRVRKKLPAKKARPHPRAMGYTPGRSFNFIKEHGIF